MKKEQLALLENQSESGHSELGHVDLFYGDETGISELAYVPYGWQSKHENLATSANHGQQINCFGILSWDNTFFSKTTAGSIDTDFIVDFFEQFSLGISKQTVVVLDNARIHVSRKIKERIRYWQKRGLYIVYLPPYWPHLNIIERLWKELKARLLKPQDYNSFDTLRYAVIGCLNQVGVDLKIRFPEYC